MTDRADILNLLRPSMAMEDGKVVQKLGLQITVERNVWRSGWNVTVWYDSEPICSAEFIAYPPKESR